MLCYLIVPCPTEHGSQCRLYVRESDHALALIDYRSNPDAWEECGHMNARGELVSWIGADDIRDFIVSCEPLAAGMTFYSRTL